MRRLLMMAMAVILGHADVAWTDTLYVSTNGTPMAPYSSWETAATNIQDAVNAASAGDSVLVSNGIYVLSDLLYIAEEITVESVNGPDMTIINAGGSVRCAYMTTGTLSGFTLTNGYAGGGGPVGGGVYLNGGGTLTNCTLSGNSADNEGGGAYLREGGTLNNCTLSGNSAGTFGGAVCLWKGGTLNNCTLSGNSSSGSGGGAYFYYAGGTLNHCTLSGNSTTNAGGGAYLYWGGTLNDCILSDNTSFDGGGAHLHYSGTLNDCLVYGNSSNDEGGGVYLNRGGTLNTCTVSGNSSVRNGSGAGLFYGGMLNNCIVWGNATGDNIYNDGGTLNSVWSSGNPHFMDPDNDNYRLAYGSPCIDAGNNYAPYGSGTDLDGNTRLVDGNGDGTNTVDVGAYEYDRTVYDSDGDHQTDYEEYIADTSATNAADFFQIAETDGSTVKFNSSSNRLYTLFSTTNLMNGSWTEVASRLGSGGADSMSSTNKAPQEFYKLGVEIP